MARPPDEIEAEKVAELVLAIRRRGEALTEASIVQALRSNTSLLRDADILGVPVEEAAAKASVRAERCRRAARKPRRSKKDRIRQELAKHRERCAEEHVICGKVARALSLSPAYVRRVRDKEKRTLANAEVRAPQVKCHKARSGTNATNNPENV